MKKIFVLCLMFWSVLTITAVEANSSPATKDDIQLIIQQMDKRFEQVDKRFEQMEKRFEFFQALLLAMLAATIGTPFLVERYHNKRDDTDKGLLRDLDRFMVAMREAANHDDKIKEILKSAKLL